MLRTATEDEKRARDVLCHPEWGQLLSAEQFAERERRLRGHPWARERMTTWLWTDGADRVLASCETFRMDSILHGQQWGDSWGVASVFTEPALRRRGHAGAMMTALLEHLRAGERAQASILFSDVGAPLYERAGYVAVEGADRVWSPQKGDPAGAVDATLSDEAVGTQWPRVRIPEDPFVIWPSARQLDWHLERERAYAQLLGKPRAVCAGARAGNSAAVWAADLKNGRLMILALSAARADEATALMQAARRTAHASGLAEVRLYDAPQPFTWPRGEVGGAVRPRDGELAMIAPLVAAVSPQAWRSVMRALWI